MTSTMRERMLAGELHLADDPELARDSQRAMTAFHPVAAGPRRDKWEAARPTTPWSAPVQW